MYLTAIIEDVEYKDEKINFEDQVYGFNMSCIKKQAMVELLVDEVDVNQIVTCVIHLKTMDITKTNTKDVSF